MQATSPGSRSPIEGEEDPDEGTQLQPLQRAPATAEGVAGLFARLGALSPNAGIHHRCVLDFPEPWLLQHRTMNTTVQSIGFMLWLPAHFLARGPWPTVFSLHGQGETRGPGDYTALGSIVRHGLPHRVPDRVPFRDQFVLVSPMMNDVRYNLSLEHIMAGRERPPQWADHLVTLEALRTRLFNHGAQLLERERAYLTGVSIGGSGTWAWAGFNPSGAQPWAAIVASSSRWPYGMNVTDVRPFHVRAEGALRRLARIPTRVAHCANDRFVPIDTGALLKPRCELVYFGAYNETTTPATYGPPSCFAGPDAIVEALRMYDGADVHYDRYEVCPMVHQPTDTSFTAMYPADRMDTGHDSGNVYLGQQFVDYLNSKRLRPQDRWW